MKPYEAINPFPQWPQSFTFAPAVRVGPFLFISGTTATDEKGNLVGKGDIAAQMRFIYEKFRRILEAAGGSLANIVETTEYIVGTENYADTAAIRRELFGGPPFPAATGVIVAGLLRRDALIEIKAVAVLKPLDGDSG